MPTSKARCDALTTGAITKMCKAKGLIGYEKWNKEELVVNCCLDDYTESFWIVTRKEQGTVHDIIHRSVVRLLDNKGIVKPSACTVNVPQHVDYVPKDRMYDDYFSVIDKKGAIIDDVNFIATAVSDTTRPISTVRIHTNEKQIDAIKEKCR